MTDIWYTDNINDITNYHLGTMMTEDWKSTIEIKGRMAIVKSSFRKRRKLLCNKSLDLRIKKRLAKRYVWSLLCGSEVWLMRKREKDWIEAFEMSI